MTPPSSSFSRQPNRIPDRLRVLLRWLFILTSSPLLSSTLQPFRLGWLRPMASSEPLLPRRSSKISDSPLLCKNGKLFPAKQSGWGIHGGRKF
uniref:Uncharacterized protein n=1 Tax=Fagus sylvatica TaxID=28930 RepID=A0A2N9HMS4_FAGSY